MREREEGRRLVPRTTLTTLLFLLTTGVFNVPASEPISPNILNETLILADTEYPVSIPGGTKHISIQCRTAFAVRFAFLTGKVAGSVAPFATIKADGAYTGPEKLSVAATTLYLASSEAGVVVEIVCWS